MLADVALMPGIDHRLARIELAVVVGIDGSGRRLFALKGPSKANDSNRRHKEPEPRLSGFCGIG